MPATGGWTRCIRPGLAAAVVVLIALVLPSAARAAPLVARGRSQVPAAQTFADAPEGAAAAANVTGGGDGPIRVVRNLNDDGAGSLRVAAEKPGPAVVLFAVSGTIT